MDTRQKFNCAKCGKASKRKNEEQDYCKRCEKAERFDNDPPLCYAGEPIDHSGFSVFEVR